ncbi:AAEL009626-PA, partial [Aedes aegypti]
KGQRPLHVAAKVGYIECVQLLIDRGADINSETKSGMTPLLFAFEIKNHHSRKACVEKLMSCSTIDVKDKNGFTTFHYAAKVGLTELIETLLKFNVDINGQSTFGESPLHIAAKNNQVDFLRKLLEKTETKNGLKDNDGLTALHYAAKHGNPKCVNLLIDFGANVNALTYETRKMPLHSAVDLTYSFRISQVEHVSRLEIVERLLLSGSRIVVDKYGCTALHYAAQNGLVDCLEPLLKKSEDANARSDSGQTPLHLAAKRNHISCVKKLLSVGQPVDEKDENGFTALLSAAYTGSECCMKLLMNAGGNSSPLGIEKKKKKKKSYKCVRELLNNDFTIDVTLQDENGFTALHRASKFGLEDCVKHLLVRGAGINTQANNGQTAFHIAAQENHPDCMKQLLRNQSLDVTIKDKKGFTALHYAATWGIVEHLKQIVERGASDDILNAQTNEGETLHYATSNDLEDYTVLLIRRGANLNVQALNGKTPLHVAIEHRNMNAIQKLCDRETINFNLRDDSGCTALQFAIKHGVEECIELLQTPEFAGQLTSV